MALSDAEKAAGMIETDIWVAVDDNEAVFVGVDSDALKEQCDENDCSVVRRVVCVTIKLKAPGFVEALVELPAESSDCKVTVS